MSAPLIPNLLNLKKNETSTAAGTSRVRGAGGRALSRPLRNPLADPDGETSTGSETVSSKQNDTIVQATDTDANISRLSAVRAGYLNDPFAKDFTPAGEVTRRFPIINRGTYARTTAIDRAVADFLESSPDSQRQIVSLGAGSDTRYFRMMHDALAAEKSRGGGGTAATLSPSLVSSSGSNTPAGPATSVNFLYHEFDFAINTQHKISTITNNPKLKALVGDPLVVRWRQAELHGPYYHLHACDLRDLDVSRPWTNADKSTHFDHLDPTLPTLLISECCLTYLAPGEADSVVRYFQTKVLSPSAPMGLVLYEPINPFDGFGKVMVANLAKRGIVLQTIRTYHSLEAQRERLRTYGLTSGQRAVSMDYLFEHWVNEKEQKRVAKVEMLDEVEELNLLAQHYCVAWGWRDGDSPEIWEKWAKLDSGEEET